jgi:chemotaxis protein histidine kinase CheA
MIPLSTVFDSLHRMVRDISKNLGKDIVLVVEGGDIELDKKMIEKLGDPLVHMLRNSLDHGIEPPEERRKAGKPGTGTVKLSACYDAGSVLIELSDDGGGIPLEKIKERALRKKMFSEDELNDMPESALVDLIFQPGFSTSSIVTDVSGRGVGMDVARRNIVEELRGSFRIETKRGRGTSFFIRLPLTLAVMRVLLVDVADTVFAIGAHYVSEIIRVPKDELITVVNKRAVRLREEIIPVASMTSLLNIPARGKTERNDVLIAIVHTGGEKLGLIIDALRDEEDMVIKPLPAHMKNIRLVSGVIISGRNEIINVVHVPAVIEAAGEIREVKPLKGTAGEEGSAIHILVVDDSINTREIEKSILESYGYKVDLAGDGLEALEKIREFKYSVVITDVEMPRLDGFSLTERLRNDEAHKDIPVIIVTSREKEEDKKRGIMVGADAYIVKGAFDQSNLLETVQNLIG